MLRNTVTFFSLLLLAAHGLRTGNTGIAVFWLIAGALLFTPWLWKNLVLAALLGFGSWLWADITLHLIQQRLALGLPWLRLSVILGSVSLLALLGSILNMVRAYRTGNGRSLVQGTAFLLTVTGLSLAMHRPSFAFLFSDHLLAQSYWPAVILLATTIAFFVDKAVPSTSSVR